jgi:Domain of unknown function (DUF4184)
MPYACAHPAAVIVLPRLLGKLAVPSALAIGSVIPDAWYFLPVVERADSHSALGLLLFCLPAGVFAYAAFHLVCKEPLLALLPAGLAARAGAFACTGLPQVPKRAVLVSIIAGALTHYAWDALTHPGALTEAMNLNHRFLQHASTVLGTVFAAWWAAGKLRAARADEEPEQLPASLRAGLLLLMLVLALAAFAIVLLAMPASQLDWSASRSLLRAAGITALSVLGFTFLGYCLLFRSISARVSSTGFDQREPM